MMPCPENEPAEWTKDDERFNNLVSRMAPRVAAYTTPILAAYGGGVRQHATGTLIRFGDHRFLVTASHAIKDFVKGQELYPDLSLLIEDGCGHLVPLHGRFSATQIARDKSRPVHADDGDDWDVAAWHLHPTTLAKLKGKSFANRTDLSFDEDLTSGVYFLVGFPCEWGEFDGASRTFHCQPFPCIAQAYPRAHDAPVFDPRFHIAIELDLPTPHPHKLLGISGCSVWKLSGSPMSASWDPSQARIVGVQTGVLQEAGFIKATQWRHVIPVLLQISPELAPGLSLQLRR
jgi:hypothetical protein